MRRFVFVRNEDVSGYSGTGVVVEGVQFSDGKVTLRWCVGAHRSSVLFDSIEDALDVHGHGGATVLKWVDSDVSQRFYQLWVQEQQLRVKEKTAA